jgi:hypothetical protein
MSPSKQYPVIDAKSAISQHNKNTEGFREIENRMSQARINKLPMPSDGQPTLADYLASNSLPNTFSIKAALAKKIGMPNYTGKPEQDKQIMGALTNLDAKQNETKGKEQESNYKDKEFALKEKELSIKEKEAENKKGPDADAIASSIMSKFNQQ